MTKVNSAFRPSGVGKSTTYRPMAGRVHLRRALGR